MALLMKTMVSNTIDTTHSMKVMIMASSAVEPKDMMANTRVL